MTFRKEKKYRLSNSDMMQVESVLSKEGMKQLFEPRKINSCYFDNSLYGMFRDSEEGVLPRKKIRYRWYGSKEIFTKETKISSIEGRYKTSEKAQRIDNLQSLLQKIETDNVYGVIKPVVIVSYLRSYYSLGGVRITFDRNIEYAQPGSIFLSTKKEKESVVEIKAPFGLEDDYIEKIINQPTARFSKYSRALLAYDHIL